MLQSVNQVSYLGVNAITLLRKFNQKRSKAKDFKGKQTIAVYCLSKSERLAANTQLTLRKALVRSAMTVCLSVCLSVLTSSLRHRPTFRNSRSAQQDGAHIDRRTARLFSKFCTYVIQSRIVQAASVKSLNNIVTMKVIVTLDKARNSAGNTKG